jgi:hypothetical protein
MWSSFILKLERVPLTEGDDPDEYVYPLSLEALP